MQHMPGIRSLVIRSRSQLHKNRFVPNEDNYRFEIKTSKGQSHVSGFLYSTKDEALKDAVCFEWFYSTYGKNIARPRCNNKKWDWSSDKPVGDDWDRVRDFLLQDWRSKENQNPNLSVPAVIENITKKKRKRPCEIDRRKLKTSRINQQTKEIINGVVVLMNKVFPTRNLQVAECLKILDEWVVRPNSTTQLIGDAYFKVLTSALEHRASKSGLNDEALISLLSVPLVAGLRLSSLNKIRSSRGESKVGRRLLARAFNHFQLNGAGAPVEKRPKSRRGIPQRNHIAIRFSEFLIREGELTASIRKVKVGGETFTLPRVYRKYGRGYLIYRFKCSERERLGLPKLDPTADPPVISLRSEPSVCLRRKEMNSIISAVCPEILRSLAALDSLSQVHGSENFTLMKKIILEINGFFKENDENTGFLFEKGKKLLALMKKIEEFLKSKGTGLRCSDHFGGGAAGCHGIDSCIDFGPAAHCSFHAFGRRDPTAPEPTIAEICLPCGHNHSGSCPECDEVIRLPFFIKNFINEVTIAVNNGVLKISNEELRALIKNVNSETRLPYHIRRYNHYVGHCARLSNESVATEEILQFLRDNPNFVHIECDWAMKILSMKYRESQTGFYAKRGIALHGIKATWFDVESNTIKTYYSNCISSDSTEDSMTTIQIIMTFLILHKKKYPHHNFCILDSDGAGTYSGIPFVGRLPYLGLATGIQILSACTGESGGGKGQVDRNFGVIKSGVKKKVTEGQGENNVISPEKLNEAIDLFQEGSKHPFQNYLIEPSRPEKGEKGFAPITTKESTSEALRQSRAYREFKYDEFGNPTKVELHSMSGLGGPPVSSISVQSLWELSASLEDILGSPEIKAKGLTLIPISEFKNNLLDDTTINKFVPRNPSTVLSKEQREIERVSKLNKRTQAVVEEEITRPSSSSIPCPIPGCVRTFKNIFLRDLHLSLSKCQQNGSSTATANKRIPPNAENNKTVFEIATSYLADFETNQTSTRSILPNTTSIQQENHFQFGWASRGNLKHPRLDGRLHKLAEWAWDYGEQRKRKIDTSKFRLLISQFGTKEGQAKYPGEKLWSDAVEESGGNRIIEDEVEEWRINSLYQSIGATKKRKKILEMERANFKPCRTTENEWIDYFKENINNRLIDGLLESRDDIELLSSAAAKIMLAIGKDRERGAKMNPVTSKDFEKLSCLGKKGFSKKLTPKMKNLLKDIGNEALWDSKNCEQQQEPAEVAAENPEEPEGDRFVELPEDAESSVFLSPQFYDYCAHKEMEENGEEEKELDEVPVEEVLKVIDNLIDNDIEEENEKELNELEEEEEEEERGMALASKNGYYWFNNNDDIYENDETV